MQIPEELKGAVLHCSGRNPISYDVKTVFL